MAEKVTMVFDNTGTFVGIIEDRDEVIRFQSQRPNIPYRFVREKEKVVQKLVVEMGYNYDDSCAYYVEDGDLIIFRDDELNMYEMFDYHLRDLRCSVEFIEQFVNMLDLKSNEEMILKEYLDHIKTTFMCYLDSPSVDEDPEGFVDMSEFAKVALKPWGVEG